MSPCPDTYITQASKHDLAWTTAVQSCTDCTATLRSQCESKQVCEWQTAVCCNSIDSGAGAVQQAMHLSRVTHGLLLPLIWTDSGMQQQQICPSEGIVGALVIMLYL